MRLLLLLLTVPLLATFAPISMGKMPISPDRPSVSAEPVPLRDDAPGERRLGRLTFLGGWWLRSNQPEFGGISAMHVSDGWVLALSDAGRVMRFVVPTRRGAAPLSLSVLPDIAGAGKKQQDTEAIAVGDGRAWIAFERRNAVHRYRLPNWTSEATARPVAMKSWTPNSGGEAMIRLRDGRFLLFCEGRMNEAGATEVLLFDGDPALMATRTTLLRYRPPAGYRITDAAELPDGRLLFLNRRFGLLEGFTAKLTLSDRPALSAGAVLGGREIAHFAPPVTTDNYEALSIGTERGRTILWIASDDNFLELERTLLMKFALDEAVTPAEAGVSGR
jgi:hypothetical protein